MEYIFIIYIVTIGVLSKLLVKMKIGKAFTGKYNIAAIRKLKIVALSLMFLIVGISSVIGIVVNLPSKNIVIITYIIVSIGITIFLPAYIIEKEYISKKDNGKESPPTE